MEHVSVEAPIPAHRSEALPPCPAPAECGEPLVRVDGRDARIGWAASYRAAGIRCAPRGCWMRAHVFALLQQAADALPAACSLLIFDAYRPPAVQRALYDAYAARVRAEHPDYTPAQLAAAVDDFVALPQADPARPAPHTTGGAVDLTLCLHGRPLDMGTAFDDFSPAARTAWLETDCRAPEFRAARANRRLLYHTLCAAGFVNYSEEWWHYSYGDRLWARTHGKTPLYGQSGWPAGPDAEPER